MFRGQGKGLAVAAILLGVLQILDQVPVPR